MLKIGMVGTGGISQSHREAWANIPEARIVAVCDVRPEMAQAAAAETGARVYTDVDEMLAAEALDALDICLPTYLHADCAIKGLERGLHVVCEKPISLNRADIARIYGAAEKNDRRFMVAQVLRFWREYAALREAIETGRYGKLLSGSMSRLGNAPKRSWNNWMHEPTQSGLVPYDLHIHDLDFLVGALGRPAAIQCHRARDGRQDYFNVVYTYPECFVAAEAAWFSCDYPFQAGYRFQFQNAVMEYKAHVLTIHHANGKKEVLDAEAPVSVRGVALKSTDAYYNELRYFTDCVLAQKPCDLVRPGELEAVLDIIDEINRS